MRMFEELVIETQGTCNRACPTCLRQSVSRGEGRMDAVTVKDLIDQATAMGFRGWLCLQFFNEPLLDDRLAEFGRHARGRFREVFANTNGDLLTEGLAGALDGALDRLHVALYGPGKDERRERYAGWFRETKLTFTDGRHVVTHGWPTARPQAGKPCLRECRMRLIVGWDGGMRLCCEDIDGRFALGNVRDVPLRGLWFGDRHREIVEALGRPGGRLAFPYCAECPR
jgi:hypothetical protein